MSWRSVYLCCVLVSSAGCGLGRPLVDHEPVDAGQKFPRVPCNKFPKCEPLRSTVLAPDRRLDMGSLPSCPIELPVDGELDLRAGEMELRDCSIALFVHEPARVRLLGARLSNVIIELFGPVRLELGEGSSLALVQIRADSVEQGGSLLLEDATATDLIASGELGWTLGIAGTALTRALLAAERIELETSTLRHGTLHTRELQVIASWLSDSRLTVEHGTVSASQLTNTSVAKGCDTLLLAGTEIVESQFGACRGALRLLFDTVRRSVLDGPLETDQTTILESVLGLEAPTRLWAWETNVYGSMFCSLSEQMRLADASLHCAGCAGPLAKARADVCTEPGTRYDGEPNTCPAFDEPVACENGFPERSWPEDPFRNHVPDGGWLALLDGGLPE